MSRLLKIIVLSSLLGSCTATVGACQDPVLDACSAKAQDVSAELSKIAAQRHVSPDEITTEFMGACEGQLQSDLDQVLGALQSIAATDGGTDQ